MDFYQICIKEIQNGPRKGEMELYPDFTVGRSTDLMVRGKGFYAIWDEEVGLWSTDEYDVQRLVDADLKRAADQYKATSDLDLHVKYLRSASNGGWYQFRKYMQNISDNSKELDSKLIFANTEVKKTDYVSKRLPYSLSAGDHSAWDELVGTLYSVENRDKIEWIIGAIVSGDSKKIQKFGVFYGPGGTGKSTILNICTKLFEGYTTSFEAKALGSNNNAFATEAFKGNPLLAIQQDGDLSKIEDNTKLNSIIAHEDMRMNEKYKPGYDARVNAFLLMGTNQPVKISDAKSGIIRRLIDIHPTGVTIPPNHYHTLMSKIDFELGAIAQHCLDRYRSMGKNYYDAYRATEMMFQTDIFFNFIEANYDVFKRQDSTTLKQAYILYKEFCLDTGIANPLPQYKVRSELQNYFDEFKERVIIDGQTVRSLYSGFNANKFKMVSPTDHASTLYLEETKSIFDEEYAAQPAQYGTSFETPLKKWDQVATTLADIDTTKLHFVKVPENHIVIDFDLKDEDGNKSLERNLAAASIWPATYGELSKGGAGVHLHYNYGGDVTELSGVYSEGIEVKTLLGDASLRRKLTKCNDVPVALYTGSLPKKEKKSVQSEKQLKSEKGLRDLIERNLRKEFGGTKSSVDFIKKILDDAYDSGMSYDVSDLQPRILAFATKSSNQALVSLRTTRDMKWKSSDVVADEAKAAEAFVIPQDDRIVLYDVEVYPNLFVICWKFEDSDQIVRMVNPTAQEVEGLLQLKLVGFYNRRYDNHIIYAAWQGYSNERLYKLSQDLISNEKNGTFANAYGISYADIWDFASIKQSLKKWEIELGLKHMEMDIPWDKPVPPELVEKVVEYCCNDVLATEAVLKHLKQDLVARQILADLSGLPVNDTTAKHTAKIIFGNDRNPQAKFLYTELDTLFPGYEFNPMVTAGKSSFMGEDPSEGGYVYSEPGMYENVVEMDIASMHPTSIVQLNLFGEYTPNFAALKDARIAIKHKNYAAAKKMLDGKLAPYLKDPDDAEKLAYALKIVINIVYGLTSAKFDNPFRDKKNVDNIVAKRGALFMINLKQLCQDRGMRVVHIKTDSIKVVAPSEADINFIHEVGKDYGYDFEHEATYDRFCLVNDAVYIAHYGWAEKQKLIGTWVAKGAQFQHPYVFKTLFSKESIEFDDLCETKQVNAGAIYMDFEHDRPDHTVESCAFVGRIGRFVPVFGARGATLWRVKDDKFYSLSGTKGHLWMEAAMLENTLEDVEIDMTYFDDLVNAAYRTVEKYGDFQSFVS